MADKTEYNNESMLDFLNGVAGYLEELTQANRNLLVSLKDYQKLLVGGETLDIERATPKVDRLTGKIRILDETRRQFVDSFFQNRGWEGPRNFTAISEKVKQSGVTDEEAAAFDRVVKARAGLIDALAQVDAQNSLNITLIGQGLSFAEVSLRALLGCDDRKSGYGPDDETGDGPSLLDARA
jgi:hypothetical protein